MNATAPAFSTTTESTQQIGEAATTTESPSQKTNFVSPKEFKELEKQRQHIQRLVKKRAERWGQPYADAKVEDVRYCLEKFNELANNFNQVLYQIEVLRKALFAGNVISEADIKAILDYDNTRVEKANELRESTTLSVDEKKAIATEFNIPLNVIGLAEEPTQGDDERNISEPSQSS